MTIDWAFLKGINGEEMLMSDNFIAFSFDEAEKSKRFYSGLTDDDIRYIEAAVRWDFDACKNMLATHFQMKMPKTVVKHEVWRRDHNPDIWEYKVNIKKKHDAGWLGEGIYFYGTMEIAAKAVDYGEFLEPFYINIEDPFRMDIDLHDAIIHENDAVVSHRMKAYLDKFKMDGVLWTGDGREEWCVLAPNQLKRATVTRDDAGRIIPLSRRFDMSNPDNRF